MASPTRRTSQAALHAVYWAVVMLLASFTSLRGQPPAASQRPLEDLSLEELLRIEVTSVSGLGIAQFSSPAAIYVITGEQIRRAGMRSLPEALRMVPGMFVGRQSASGWTTGARGLTGLGITANRYLVLIDGRAVFDPLLSVALWDVIDVPIEVIDRIEVIAGPGPALWGVNAMNGVISILTRSADETLGGKAVVSGGTETRALGSVSWGAETAGGTAYRVWGKYFEMPDFELFNGASAHDHWSSLRGGVRADGDLARGVRWTLEASAYDLPELSTSTREPVPGEHLVFRQVTTNDDAFGGFARFSAGRDADPDNGWSVQGYVDRAERDTTRIAYQRDIFDLDWRNWRSWGESQDLVWGLQVDRISDTVRAGSNFIFEPESRDWWQLNGFIQNTSELVSKEVFAMIGTKVTYHDFVGVEAQPSARIWWTPSGAQTLWAAVSRPVRVPSRLEENGMIVVAYADPGILSGGPPTGAIPFGIRGSEDLAVEELLAYELGYRWRAGDWALSSAIFYNDYSTLIGLPPSAIGSFSDAASGTTYGMEIYATGRLTDRWQVNFSWSALDVEIDGPVSQFEETSAPRNMAQLRSTFDVGENVELDGGLYYVSELTGQRVDDYLRLDVGASWKPRGNWRLSLWGQNLMDDGHRETSAIEVPRGGYLSVELWF